MRRHNNIGNESGDIITDPTVNKKVKSEHYSLCQYIWELRWNRHILW